jgi:phage terminase Nu1 subunit (DNA packaging protein)
MSAVEKDLPKQLVGIKVIAYLYGVGIERIRKLTSEGIIKTEPDPKAGDNRHRQYDLYPTIRNLFQHDHERKEKRTETALAWEDEKLKQAAVKRKLEELKLAQLEGELVKAEHIERVMGAVLTRLRINLLSIAKGVAPQLKNLSDENAISGKIHERIVRALNEVVSIDLDALLANEE